MAYTFTYKQFNGKMVTRPAYSFTDMYKLMDMGLITDKKVLEIVKDTIDWEFKTITDLYVTIHGLDQADSLSFYFYDYLIVKGFIEYLSTLNIDYKIMDTKLNGTVEYEFRNDIEYTEYDTFINDVKKGYGLTEIDKNILDIYFSQPLPEILKKW